MKGPKKIRIKSKYILWFLSILCFGMIVLTIIDSEFARPVRNVVAKVVMPVQKGVNFVGGYMYDKAEMLKELTKIKEEKE